MVLDIQPIADLQAIAVDRQRLPFDRAQDHQWDELLGELSRSVVVRAVAYDHGQSVRSMPGAHQMVRRRLRRRVRTARPIGRIFRERCRVGLEVAEHLVSRDMMKPETVPRVALKLPPMGKRGLKERYRSNYIGL